MNINNIKEAQRLIGEVQKSIMWSVTSDRGTEKEQAEALSKAFNLLDAHRQQADLEKALRQTPRLLINIFKNGQELYLGRYLLQDGETHQQAAEKLMKNLPNRRHAVKHEGRIDCTGAAEIVIF